MQQTTTGPGTEKCALALFFLFFTLLIFVITNTNIRVKEASPRPPVIQQTPGLATEKCENLLAIKSDLSLSSIVADSEVSLFFQLVLNRSNLYMVIVGLE